MKAQVLEWYELHKANFPSLDSAAEAVVVTEKLVPVTFRTAREWIGEYARRIRSARTP